MTDQRSLSIVSITAAGPLQADLLLNIYEPPLDPEAIVSCIHQVRYSDDGVLATSLFEVDHWLTHMHRHGDWLATCSMEGHVHRFDGSAWKTLQTPADDGLNAVFIERPGRIHAVALDGSVLLIENDVVRVASPAGPSRLNAIHGVGETLYAVGDEGRLMQLNGDQWSDVEPFTNSNLLSVLCLAPGRVLIGGVHGGLWLGHGNLWQELDAASYSMSSFAQLHDQVWMAAGSEGILQLDEHNRVRVAKRLALYRVAANPPHLLAAGNDLFVWWDGGKWQGLNYQIN